MVKLKCCVFLLCCLYPEDTTNYKSVLILIRQSQNMRNSDESVVLKGFISIKLQIFR